MLMTNRMSSGWAAVALAVVLVAGCDSEPGDDDDTATGDDDDTATGDDDDTSSGDDDDDDTGTPPVEDTAVIIVDDDPATDLLFVVEPVGSRDEGAKVFFSGFEDGDGLHVTHVVIDDPTDGLALLAVTDGFLPVMWVSSGLSITVGNAGAPDPLDATAAAHVAFTAEDGVEIGAIVDIAPGAFGQVFDTVESITEIDPVNARQFVADHGLADWDALVARAQTNDADQPRYIAAAIATGVFAAAAGIIDTDFSTELPVAAPPPPIGSGPSGAIARQFIRSMLAQYLSDAFAEDPYASGAPTFETLHCGGASTLHIIGVCHDIHFHAVDVGLCVNNCLTSMSCFTSICMPTTVSTASISPFLEENGFYPSNSR